MSCYPYDYIPDCHKDMKYALCLGCWEEFNTLDLTPDTLLCVVCEEKIKNE